MNKVVIFSAPSGSGKTTLVKHCLEVFPSLEFSISATTREPRGSEEHGKDYYFFSPEEFRQKISEDAFVEYEEVYADKFYGTLKSEIERIWDSQKVVIFDVDVVGGLNLKKILGEKAMSVFIAPPSVDELEQRLINRDTDSEETIKTRINKAQEELEYKNQFDEVLVNDDLDKAKQEIEKLVQKFIQ
jgi:hypothetical protein